jgi:hypothetical protein
LLGQLSLLASTAGCQQILGITDPLPAVGGGSGAQGGSGGQGGSTGGTGGTGGGGGVVVTAGPLTGIWYSTAYANEGRLAWSTNVQPASFNGLCDFNGDDKLDGLIRIQATWSLLASNGTAFPNSQGLTTFGAASDEPLVGDVNGDQNCDVAVFTSSSGTWTAGKSNGSAAVLAPAQYLTGFGALSGKQFLADVNGDGRADAIAFYSDTGRWNVALSDSAADRFIDGGVWRDGVGAGSVTPMVADVTGDDRADIAVFNRTTGEWRVAKSTGTAFDAGSVWITGFGNTSTDVLLGDVTGDGRADAVSFISSTGTWEAAPAKSTADGFDAPRVLAREHGIGSVAQMVGDVVGGGTAALVAVSANGGWQVLPSGFLRPAAFNTWESANVRYVPVGGVYRSNDDAVIGAHLAALISAKIDFAVLDLTRYPVTDDEYPKSNALALCAAVGNAVRLGNATPTFAIAVGAVRQTHDPQTIEAEAEAVWTDFVTSSRCVGRDAYFALDGRPLLVVAAEYADRLAWEAWTGDKASTSQFTLRWAQNRMPGSDPNVVPPGRYGEYYGFAYGAGPLDDPETMVVLPGYNDHAGLFVSRGVAGDTYEQAWASVSLLPDPRVVVIESFNDYFNETAVAPTDTSAVVSPSEPWLDANSSAAPDLYWNLTIAHNGTRKN